MWPNYEGERSEMASRHSTLVALFETPKKAWEDNDYIEEQLHLPGVCDEFGDVGVDLQKSENTTHNTYLESLPSPRRSSSPKSQRELPRWLTRCFLAKDSDTNFTETTLTEDSSPRNDYFYAPSAPNDHDSVHRISKTDSALDALSHILWKCSVGCSTQPRCANK